MDEGKKAQVLADLQEVARNVETKDERKAELKQQADAVCGRINDYIVEIVKPVLDRYSDLLKGHGATASVTMDAPLVGQLDGHRTLKAARRITMRVTHYGCEGSVSVSASAKGVELTIKPAPVVLTGRQPPQTQFLTILSMQADQIEDAVKTMTARMVQQTQSFARPDL